MSNRCQSVPLVALPYESLRDFNRRVEDTMRPSISSAIQASKASAIKKKAKPKPGADADPASTSASTSADPAPKAKTATPSNSVDPFVPPPRPARRGPTEFAAASQLSRPSDVVQAPPVLRKAKRGLDKGTSVTEPLPESRMPVSGLMREMMEREREKAVRAYRELKDKREKEQRGEAA